MKALGAVFDTHNCKDHSPIVQSHFLDNPDPRVYAGQKHSETQASFYPSDGNKAGTIVDVWEGGGGGIRHPGS